MEPVAKISNTSLKRKESNHSFVRKEKTQGSSLGRASSCNIFHPVIVQHCFCVKFFADSPLVASNPCAFTGTH